MASRASQPGGTGGRDAGIRVGFCEHEIGSAPMLVARVVVGGEREEEALHGDTAGRQQQLEQDG